MKIGMSLIAGKVYNITPYMDFHPGGVPELMRAAGKDGTKLFDEVSLPMSCGFQETEHTLSIIFIIIMVHDNNICTLMCKTSGINSIFL